MHRSRIVSKLSNTNQYYEFKLWKSYPNRWKYCWKDFDEHMQLFRSELFLTIFVSFASLKWLNRQILSMMLWLNILIETLIYSHIITIYTAHTVDTQFPIAIIFIHVSLLKNAYVFYVYFIYYHCFCSARIYFVCLEAFDFFHRN